MSKRSISFATSLAATLLLAFVTLASISHAAPAAGKDTVLKPKDITTKLIPETVFFRGQTAPTQMRNAAGIHFADDFYLLTTPVDNSGYSSTVRAKYQAYLLSEVPLEIGGQSLKAGAYGFGFIEGGKFIVMDLGANDLFTVTSQRDAEIKHPTPLQIVAGASAGTYRLYMGRDFVEFKRSN